MKLLQRLSLLLCHVLYYGCAATPLAVQATLSVEERVLQKLVFHGVEQTRMAETPLPQVPHAKSYSTEVTQGPSLPFATPAQDQKSTDALPEEHFIWNIWGHRQYFPIGCEAAVAKDWAAYFGVEINEFNFQYELPQSDNPDFGFVGSVEGPWGQVPPYAYGVHAAPVAKLLREKYGMNALATKGFNLEQLKKHIAMDKPVIAWVIGNCVGGVPHEFVDKEGNTVVVAAYEHVVIVTGYNSETIRYMNNGKFFDIPIAYFLNSWSVLGNMVVFLEQ